MKRTLKPAWHLHVVIRTIVILSLLILFVIFNTFSHTFAMPRRVLNHHYRIPGVSVPLLQQHTVLSRTAVNKVLHLSISLTPRNQDALDTLLLEQSNPASPLYHHYLTPSEFKSHFGPTTATIMNVVSYLQSQHLNVTSISPNNLAIKATGTVGTTEKAFLISMNNYALNGRVVFATTLNPSVPDALVPAIQNISGLDDVAVYKHSVLTVPQTKMMRHSSHTGPGGGYTPSELRTAYDVNALTNAGATGAGQTAAIFELDGYNPSDINTYLSHYNLGTSKYSNVLLDGATNTPGSGAVEVTLDMEVVSALAPNALQRIYIGPNSTTGVNDLYGRIVTDNTAKVVSTSWGQCEANSGSAEMTTLNNIFRQGAAQGQSFFAASGDAGAYDCGNGTLSVDSPANEPNVVGVGGTNLSIGNGGTYGSEAGWFNTSQKAGGGGGISSFFTRPAYQNGPNLTSTNRMVPDVSADADPASGYSIFCSGASDYCNGWAVIGGTSAAAPLWAGIAVDINQYLLAQGKSPLGNVNAALYTLYNTPQPYAAYHDVTTGQNLYYRATTGYDTATGIGTPDSWNIARDLAGVTAGSPTPTATPTSVVAPTPSATTVSVTLPPSNGFTSQLLQSPGFEYTNSGWWQRSGRGYSLFDQLNPHSGTFSAHLCGYTNCNDELYQTVNVPSTTTHVTLSYWVYVANGSTAATTCASNLYSILRTSQGSPISLVQSLCNTDAHGWAQYTFDLSNTLARNAGQAVQLYFNARTSNQTTSFYVDDATFTVTDG